VLFDFEDQTIPLQIPLLRILEKIRRASQWYLTITC
jgi:hypothetical protein